MSRRFGRNQRRRAREALAQAQELAQRMTLANAYSQALARSLGEDVRTLKQTLNEAMEAAGRLSVLFPAEEMKATCEPLDRVLVDVPQLVAPKAWTAEKSVEDYATFYVADLNTLITSVRRSDFDMAVHAEIRFADGQWRYGIERRALLAMGRERAEREFTARIARDLARALVNHNIPGKKP